MSSQGPLPYLRVGGVEIANAARTLEYLRAGLGDNDCGTWILGTGDLCNILYREDVSGCVPFVFTSPAADPAPWYDPDDPASEEFLGLFMLDIKGYDSVVTRVVTPRVQGLGGATFSGQRYLPREWMFKAALISATDAGAEYGLRWLTAQLSTPSCDLCETTDVTVRLVCPPDDCSDDDLGQWTSYDVALISGPKETSTWAPRPATFDGTMAGGRQVVDVEWAMTAGNPYLYKPSVHCLEDETVGEDTECDNICTFLFGPPGEAHCCIIDTPSQGTVAPIYTFVSTTQGTIDTGERGMGSLILGAYEGCPVGTDEGSPVYELIIGYIPSDSTVVVDCARQKITVIDNETLEETDGGYLIDLSEGRSLEWPQASDCDAITCFCARTQHPCSQGGNTTVAIATQYREG